jgi:predicted membrane channel-forming protein YqfA (hemolysin III family)
MVGLILGVLLIIIAIILAAVNLVAKKFDSSDVKWYFRGLFVVIGLIGIILAGWGLYKREAPKKPAKTS